MTDSAHMCGIADRAEGTLERPLSDVLLRTPIDFTPAHPDRRPWHQPTLRSVELASTGIVATVPLAIADRVHLHGLDQPSWERDWLEPTDWMRGPGWGVGPTAVE
jgi:hypothetical protein